MRHHLIWLAIFSATVFFLITPFSASAQSENGGPVSLLAIDENSSFNSASWDVARTVSTVWADSAAMTEGTEVLLGFGLQRDPIQELDSSGAHASILRYFGMTQSSVARSDSDFFGALADGYSYFLDAKAPEGSSIFAVTSGYLVGDAEMANFHDLAAAFAEKGWRVDIASLPDSPVPSREMFSSFAQASGGSYFDLSTNLGITSLFQSMSDETAPPLIDLTITSGSAAVAVPIAPYTDASTLTLYRSSPSTVVSLYRPDGSFASHDATGVEVVEAPNALVLHLKTPSPGDWVVIAQGRGNVMLFQTEINPLQLRLTDRGAVDAGKPYSITAAPFVNGAVQPIESAWIEARVANAADTRAVYELRDNGIGGDVAAGDGIFTATAPPLDSPGLLDVELVMRWEEYRSTIISGDSFEAKVFPTISVTETDLAEVSPNRFEVIATVIQGKSEYLVPIELISADLTTSDGAIGALLVEPVDLRGGEASQFTISGDRSSENAASLQVRIEGLSGFGSSIISNSEVLSYDRSDVNPSFGGLIALPEWAQVGLPYWLWAAIVPVVIAIILGIVWMFRRTRPFGYLYDDLDAVVVDFNSLKRSFPRRLFHPDRVDTGELDLEGFRFKGGTFRFKNEGVELHYKSTSEPESPLLRANGRPAGEVVNLSPNVVLGIGGRLLTFSTEEKLAPVSEEPNEVPFRSVAYHRAPQFPYRGS